MIKPIKRCEHNAQPMELTFSDAAILFLLRHKYGLDPIRTATAMGHVKRNIRPCSNDYCDAYVEALEAVFQDRLTFYSKIWNDGPAALGKADARALNAMKYHAIDPMTAPPTNTSPAVPEAAQSDPPPLGSSSPPYEQGKPGSRSSEDGTHTRSAMQEAMDQAAEHDPDSLFIPQDDT